MCGFLELVQSDVEVEHFSRLQRMCKVRENFLTFFAYSEKSLITFTYAVREWIFKSQTKSLPMKV